MQCERVFLREPVIGAYEAMGNQLLTLSMDLYLDKIGGLPYDLTDYTARGALKKGHGGTVTPLTSATITQTSLRTNVTGLLAKATVEGLTVNTAYIFDLSVDNATTGDSFCLWTGTIVFREGAST